MSETEPSAGPSVLVERHDRVVVLRLNRPDSLNALSSAVMTDMVAAAEPLDGDPTVGCFVVTGSKKAFAAGADIKEMQPQSFAAMYTSNFFAQWQRFADLRTPKLAAVNGFALGGGCELAMMCDAVYAGDGAKFGQPEIKLGVIPGMGGSQRLTNLVGKSKAMDMILTGRMIDAQEAERAGLAARVFPADDLVDEVIKIATTIAGYGKIATMAAREAVLESLEMGERAGVRFERRVFHALFATEDQKEGMTAFTEKRDADFTGQ